MFGGLAFLVGGHMVVAASRQGGALVRCDPARTDALIARAGAEPMVMRGRPMDGWVFVDGDHVRTKRQLTRWVDEALAYVATLSPKPAKATKRVRSARSGA